MASDDLIERLRARHEVVFDLLCNEAAARIEALEAENARLRKGRDFYAGKFADRCGDVFKLKAQLAASDAAQERARNGRWKLGDSVCKKKGSAWHGKIVGFYSTDLTPIGYAVESSFEPGSVQIYPESALEDWGLAVPAQEAMEGEG